MADIKLIVTLEELSAEGCEEIKSRRGRRGYVIGDEVIAVECTKCGEVMRRASFSNHRKKFLGVDSHCKECQRRYHADNRERDNEQRRIRYKVNLERELEQRRIYYEGNRERFVEWKRDHRQENSGMNAVIVQRRRARLAALPDDLTYDEHDAILDHFGNACALTGDTKDIHLDHVIPISWGHGGTTFGNLITLRGDLNTSKGNRHLFEWFYANKERFDLDQRRFDELVTYLADINETTPDRYRDYVDYTDEYRREVCEETGELADAQGSYATNEKEVRQSCAN